MGELPDESLLHRLPTSVARSLSKSSSFASFQRSGITNSLRGSNNSLSQVAASGPTAYRSPRQSMEPCIESPESMQDTSLETSPETLFELVAQFLQHFSHRCPFED